MWNDIKKLSSCNPNVWKYVFEKDNAVAEAVLYRYPEFNTRTVICCSTESGCRMGCRFCGAGDHFIRSLTADEIVDQPRHLLESNGIDPEQVNKMQIMFMSMGEPMLNYDQLEIAIRELYDLYPKAALLISTVGPPVDASFEKLEKLSQEIPTIGLQFSVHESTDEARKKLIPTKTYTLEQIAKRGESWHRACGRRPYFNYCVHEKNNTVNDVIRLERLFDPRIWNATISVICERDENVAAANERQRKLADDFMTMMVDLGYDTRMFDPAGQDDIGGGCGQLWFVQSWMEQHKDLIKQSRGFGLPVLHTPREIA